MRSPQRQDPSASDEPDHLEGLFLLFENWIDPFRDGDAASPPRSAFGFVRYFLAQTRWPFIAFLVIAGVVGFIETSLFWFVGLIIDALNASTPETVWQDNAWLFGLMAFTLLVLRTLFWSLNALINEQTLVPGFFQLVRWQSHRHVLRQSYQFFQDDFAGRVATKVMQSGQSTGDFLISIINSIWFFLVFGLTSIGLFVALDWRLGLVLVAWFGAYVWMAFRIMPQVRKRARYMADMKSGLNGRIVDSYTNVQTVKLFSANDREDSFAREGMELLRRAVARLSRLITSLRMILSALNGVMLVVLGWMCISFWQAGHMTTGEIATVLGLGLRLNNMSGWIMFQINAIFRDLGTIQDSVNTVSQPHDVVDSHAPVALPPVKGRVRFDGVTFHYGKDSGVFDRLSFEVKPGEKVGIVGRSGAGKTTLMSLLLRLYDVEGGRILIDDTNIATVRQDALRGAIGVVTQDTSLLHRSVRDNIAYGAPDASMRDVEAAARRANAHEFIVGLRDVKGRNGYDAHVGERGVKLSGGQRQRIALARVFLKNAPLLVLDEATSALDSEVEAAIQDNLATLMDGKTVIAIAHRLSTIAHLDRLIVLDGGKIVEEGSHEALLRAGGLYASLWERQSGGFLSVKEAAE
ncbi:MAG: ABC transporter ATP-binding protein [Ahrensia sp.]|nr:ABC transporter ATP-binding protein [Ahrensia sp.]